MSLTRKRVLLIWIFFVNLIFFESFLKIVYYSILRLYQTFLKLITNIFLF